jgi:hypothetical protein
MLWLVAGLINATSMTMGKKENVSDHWGYPT